MTPAKTTLPLATNVLLDDTRGFQRYHKHTYGRAKYVFDIASPSQDTLEVWQEIGRLTREHNMPVKVIGDGTNLFITQEGFDGLLIRYLYPTSTISVRDGTISCSSGVPLHSLVLAAAEHGLDLAYLAGIPGTVGGAVAGNAGSSTWKRNIGEVTVSIETFDLHQGREVSFDPRRPVNGKPFFAERTNFIRQCNFPVTRYVIRTTLLKPPAEKLEVIKDKIAERLTQRIPVDSEGVGTAGSFFASAILPKQLSEIQGKHMLVRDLVTQAVLRQGHAFTPVPQYSVNGARFTGKYAYFKTDSRTQDSDAAEVIKNVLQAVEEQYHFTPRMEVDIIGTHGSLTVDEFIGKYAKN